MCRGSEALLLPSPPWHLAHLPILYPLFRMDSDYPARHWCFTYYFETPDNPYPDHCFEHLEFDDRVEYACWQLEACPKTGREHFQGYVCLRKKLRRAPLKHLLQTIGYVKQCGGTPRDNVIYCSKSLTSLSEVFEVGIFPSGKGNRTDLDDVHKALQTGLTRRAYRDEYFSTWIRFPNLVENYQAHGSLPRDGSTPTKATVILGRPRLGKSTFAHKLCLELAIAAGDTDFFRKPPGKWWNTYAGEKVVYIEEMRGSHSKFDLWKQYLDPFKLLSENKNGHVDISAKHFVMTSNYCPTQWWRAEVVGGATEAITGRFTEIYYFESLGVYKRFDSWDEYQNYLVNPKPQNIPFVLNDDMFE